MSAKRIIVDFQPIGKRVQADAGDNLLGILQGAGISINSICAGKGTCGQCIVEPIEGDLNQPSENEIALLKKHGYSQPFRLACQTEIKSDARIKIPAGSFSTPQRTQLEGNEDEFSLQKFWKIFKYRITPPKKSDLSSDLSRFRNILGKSGIENLEIPNNILQQFSKILRKQNWSGQAAVRTSSKPPRLGSISHSNKNPLGLAIDIGTTKLAGFLLDLESGLILAKAGAMNPLIAYGEDVVSRIEYVNTHIDGSVFLHRVLIESINELLHLLCNRAGKNRTDVLEVSAVGNTVMHHLFCNLPVEQLGYSPFVPSVSESLQFSSSNIGLEIAPGGLVYMPPNLAGYVGADHVAMLVASGALRSRGHLIALDIGTNTEISLITNKNFYCCSCASGPAFEGAHISSGMRAAEGAIEHVRFLDDEFQIQVIGNVKPIGICGSGILDAIASMRVQGVLNQRGIIMENAMNVVRDGKSNKFNLVNSGESGTGKPIHITRSDVNQIQLAKAAIRAGIDTLIHEVGLRYDEIDEFIVAGAFGTYLDVESAIQIGMFPELPISKFRQIGNAAGSGARQFLLSNRKRIEAEHVDEKMHYIELSTIPVFTELFMNSMYL